MRSTNSLKQPINPHHYHYIHHQTPHLQPQQPLLPSDYETRLRDEVLYLHSLWHRGPPRPTTPLFLRPSNQAHFKKSKPKKPKQPTSDKPWPVPSKPTSPSPTVTPWPDFKPVSKPISRPATAEEKDRVLGVKIHLKGLDLCSGLVNGVNTGRDDDDDNDDDDEEEEVIDDANEYDFLMKVFEENKELREFYERKCEEGEFYCLVCGVLVNQLRKKYKNCVALVQHCVTVSKTKKKAAHRALGHVICKVLGWDVNRLPSLPLNAAVGGGDAGGTVQSSSEVQRESKNNTDGHVEVENEGLKTDEVCQNSENVQLEKDVPLVPSGELVECESALTEDAAN